MRSDAQRFPIFAVPLALREATRHFRRRALASRFSAFRASVTSRLPDLTIPLIAASVFTAGGYGILRAERHAEGIGDLLSAAFVLCVSISAIGMTAFFAERHRPHGQARGIGRGRAAR